MRISYKKLWKLLDLISMAGISGYTLNKLNKGETVTSEMLTKIYKALNCNIDDIMEISEN